MIVTLIVGLCAMVLEPRNGSDPMVAIGTTAEGTVDKPCFWRFVTVSGTEVTVLVPGVGVHVFHIDIEPAYATVFIDGEEFRLVRSPSP